MSMNPKGPAGPISVAAAAALAAAVAVKEGVEVPTSLDDLGLSLHDPGEESPSTKPRRKRRDK